MKYFLIILILFPILYLLSYAKHEWKRNKLAAVGAALWAMLSFLLPTILLFVER